VVFIGCACKCNCLLYLLLLLYCNLLLFSIYVKEEYPVSVVTWALNPQQLYGLDVLLQLIIQINCLFYFHPVHEYSCREGWDQSSELLLVLDKVSEYLRVQSVAQDVQLSITKRSKLLHLMLQCWKVYF
jgi:hypothetical protein